MRKGINGLTAIIRSQLGRSPLSGDVFIFFNRQKNQVKLVLWENDGFGLYLKRLERGTFEIPASGEDGNHVAIPWQDLQFILQGVDLSSVRFRKRYQRLAAAS